MVRKLRHRKDPDALIGVGIHPELHRIISHQAIDGGQTIRERLHAILCRELGRPDLLDVRPEAATAS